LAHYSFAAQISANGRWRLRFLESTLIERAFGFTARWRDRIMPPWIARQHKFRWPNWPGA
jgi:hypothetical protein